MRNHGLHIGERVLAVMTIAVLSLCVGVYAQGPTLPDSIGNDSPEDTMSMNRPMRSTAEEEGEPPYVNRYLPLAPNSAALARYGEYPVSHTTGVPQISIPIYNIEIGGYTLPISLSYHASGVRVDDVASTVGLGWSLNAGGVITRSVEGTPDFSNAIATDTTYYNVDGILNLIYDHNIPVIYNLLKGRDSSYDTESDRYTFNFADKSGVMRYSYRDDEFITLNNQTFKVNYSNTPLGTSRCYSTYEGGFIICDTDGTEYVFEEKEHVGTPNDEHITEVSAWYLTRIVTLQNDTIQLKYRNDSPFDRESRAYLARVGGEYVVSPDGMGDYDERVYNSTVIENVSPFSTCTHKQLLIESIEWRGNKVSFTYTQDREDIAPSRLSIISVINFEGDTLKSISLSHDYLGTTTGDKRMMLNSVEMSDEGTYSFVYNRSRNLPDINHFPEQTDYWGYYNGNLGVHLPKEMIIRAIEELKRDSNIGWLSQVYLGNDYSSVISGCADLTCDTILMKVGSLQEIVFPTGGHTTFEYEPNVFAGEIYGGLRIKKITSHPGYGHTPVSRTFSYLQTTARPHPRYSMWYKGARIYRLAGSVYSIILDTYFIHSSTLGKVYESSAPLFHTCVKESYDDGTYTIYDYDKAVVRNMDGMNEESCHPVLYEYSKYDEGFTEPILISQREYDSQDNLLSKTSNTYQVVNVKHFPIGARIVNTLENHYPGIGVAGPDYFDFLQPEYRTVTAQAKFHRLTQSVDEDFTTGMRTVTTYTYDEENNALTHKPKRVTLSNGDGNDVTTISTFVFERGDSLSRYIADYHFATDLVVATETRRGGHTADYTATFYTLVGEGIFLNRIRKGQSSSNTYDKVRLLNLDRYGNRPVSVLDDAAAVLRPDATDFVDGADNGYEYDYDMCGRLVRDDNRGIERITYDNSGNPREICFAGGNRTRYVYSPDGVKLRTVHLTALAPVSEPLAEASAYGADSTDYIGPFTYRNGVFESYRFGGGYITYDDNTRSQTYHYYDTDHLGNIRAVVSGTGQIEQVTHYYPFGGIFADASTNQSLQQFKYNGKELDRMHGLDTYDYGFRQYSPLVPAWDRIDPLCEKSYDTSPYSICRANPINYVDRFGLFADSISAADYLKSQGYTNDIIENIILKSTEPDKADSPFFIMLNSKGAPYEHGNEVLRCFGDTESGDSYKTSASGATIAVLSTPSATVETVMEANVASQTGYINYVRNRQALNTKHYGISGTNVLKVSKTIGHGLTGASIIVSFISVSNDIREGNYSKGIIRFATNGVIIGSAFIPLVGPAINFSLSMVEAMYGEQFYDYMSN